MSSAVEFFKENLLKIMEDSGYSQKELARKVDIVPQALNKYLKGHRVPGLEVIDKFAQALHISPHMLLADPVSSPQAYLSKEEVYDAFLKAHYEKNKEGVFEGLSRHQRAELLNTVEELGGWSFVHKHLKEEAELRKKGQVLYNEVKHNLLGPQPRVPNNTSQNELVTSINLKDKDL